LEVEWLLSPRITISTAGQGAYAPPATRADTQAVLDRDDRPEPVPLDLERRGEGTRSEGVPVVGRLGRVVADSILWFYPLKRYGRRSAVNGDGCREAIGSTIATDDATRAHRLPVPAYMAIDSV
jgi:hypothetical protein